MESCTLASTALMKPTDCFHCPFNDCITEHTDKYSFKNLIFRAYIISHWTHVDDRTLSLLLGVTRRTVRRLKFAGDGEKWKI